MAPHSSTLAWKIPWMEEPGRLHSMGSLRVGHDWVTSLSLFTFHFHALEKEMATHSSILAWRIPGTGEPGGLPSQGSNRVEHDWRDLAAAAAWSILVYVPHTLENKVYSAVAGQCSVNVNQVKLVDKVLKSAYCCIDCFSHVNMDHTFPFLCRSHFLCLLDNIF